jgi:hypothetical protein
MTSAITLSRVAALCLLAGAAHASPVPVSAADAGAPVPATVYAPAAQYRPAAPDTASPDRAWREQNRIVAAQNSMMLTMGGGAQDDDPHAAHAGHSVGAHAAMAMPASMPISMPMSMRNAPPARCGAGNAAAPAGTMSGAAAMSCCADGGCDKGACCCKDGAAMGACCGKDAAGAPQSCAPAMAAPGTHDAQSGGHHHGAQP